MRGIPHRPLGLSTINVFQSRYEWDKRFDLERWRNLEADTTGAMHWQNKSNDVIDRRRVHRETPSCGAYCFRFSTTDHHLPLLAVENADIEQQ